MNMSTRLLSVLIATGCAISAVTAVTACSSPPVAEEAENNKKTAQASSVSIVMFDKAGNDLGSCSGTLVAKDLVLTAGHCAAGAAKWKITHADATSEATRATTPWKQFGSDLSHPDHSDLALLVLTKPIELDRYPSIATTKMADGTRAMRLRRSSATSTAAVSGLLPVSSAKSKGFHLK